MKNIIMSLIIFLMLTLMYACKTQNIQTNENDNSNFSTMYYVLDDTLHKSQLDSLIIADSLSNLDTWHNITLLTNDNNIVNQYLYIKNRGKSIITYSVTFIDNDTIFLCSKKIAEK